MLSVATGHDLREAGLLLRRKCTLNGWNALVGSVPAPLCRPLHPATAPNAPAMLALVFARLSRTVASSVLVLQTPRRIREP